MARCLALLLAALLPLSAQAQSTPPAEGKRIAAVGDPARLALEAWLEVYTHHYLQAKHQLPPHLDTPAHLALQHLAQEAAPAGG